MNQLILLGNVGNDAETHQFDANRYAIRFNLAVTESWKDAQGAKQTKTEWFRCTRFSSSPNLASYIKKGTKLLVTGKASAEAYIKDGQAIAVPICNVRDVQFIESNNSVSKPTDATESTSAKPNGLDTDPDDLPF